MADRTNDRPLEGRAIAFLVANEGVEQVELTEPWKAVEQAGGRPVLVAPKAGTAQAFHHLDKGDTFPVDQTVADADPQAFTGLVLPGGVANPDQLRMDRDTVAFVRAIVDRATPIAVICHGPWTLVEAAALRNRTVTSWPSLRTDISNAGGTWVDEEVHVDDTVAPTIVSSRNPDDLPAFCRQLVEIFAATTVAA